MGRRGLEQFPQLKTISCEAQNRLWDTARVSEQDEKVRVFTDPRPPIGRIGLTMTR